MFSTRLAELAARECDGKDAFSVPVLIAAIRQRRLEVKCGKLEARLAPVADYGWMTGNPDCGLKAVGMIV